MRASTDASRSQTIAVREPRLEDHDRWCELWEGYLRFYRTRLPHPITDFTWQRLIDPAADLYGFVAVDAAGEVVGIAHYHFHQSTWSLTSYCYLEDLFVDSRYRRGGAGRALIQAVYRAADQRGATRVYWSTEQDNLRAQALYNRVATLTSFVQYRR